MKSRWSPFSGGEELTGFRWNLTLRIRDANGHPINGFEASSLNCGDDDQSQLEQLRKATLSLQKVVDQIEDELKEDN